MKRVKITQDPEKPVPVEVLAESIKTIADGVRRLRQGPLNDRALVLLIQHAAPKLPTGRYGQSAMIGRQDVVAVLEGLDALERTYLKPKKSNGII